MAETEGMSHGKESKADSAHASKIVHELRVARIMKYGMRQRKRAGLLGLSRKPSRKSATAATAWKR